MPLVRLLFRCKKIDTIDRAMVLALILCQYLPDGSVDFGTGTWLRANCSS